MTLAYYNEHDPYAAAWLRNLIAAGHIAPGVVDERDMRDIRPEELAGFTQGHFFAGIGVWSYALRRAGISDDTPLWTGSCPCQPFSAAGRRGGTADERHLWPHWHWLISQCRPPVVLGEQVASKDGLGWVDLVSADMEGTGYAFGAVDLCAAGFQQAHLRQRLYFVGLADTASSRREPCEGDARLCGADLRSRMSADQRGFGRSNVGLADDDDDAGLEGRFGMPERADQFANGSDGLAGRVALTDGRQCDGVADTEGRERDGQTGGRQQGDGCPTDDRQSSRVANSPSQRRDRRADTAGSTRRGGAQDDRSVDRMAHAMHTGRPERRAVSGDRSSAGSRADGRVADPLRDQGKIAARWLDVDWLLCRNPAGEPSWRPVESGSFPLAHGVPGRMGKLRAYGNALDAETAFNFCQVVKDLI